jgi:membrane-associated phospholipid phosphatase
MVRGQRDFTNRRTGTTRFLEIEIATAVIVLVVTAGIVIASVPVWSTAEFTLVRAMNSAHSAPLDALALTINRFSPPIAATIIAVAAGGIAAVTRSVIRSAHFVVLVALPWLGSDVIKLIVARPRPDGALLTHKLISESSFSYPSGHTAFFASLGIALVVLARGKTYRPAIITLVSVVVVGVGLSRVYLGVHYPTDVVASALYSIAAVTIVDCIFQLLLPRIDARNRVPAATGFRGDYDPSSYDS